MQLDVSTNIFDLMLATQIAQASKGMEQFQKNFWRSKEGRKALKRVKTKVRA